MIDRFSLRWKMPAIIALILIGSVISLGALAYDAARRSALEGARDRLTHAASEVATIGSNATAGLQRTTETRASDPALVDAFRRPGEPLPPAALAVLRRLRPSPESMVKLALVDMNGRAIEGVTPELIREVPEAEFTPVDSFTVSPFRMADGMLEYMVAAPVRDSGRVVGQLLQWRRIARGPQSLILLESLIGDSATMLIGNRDGSLKVEFRDTIQAPVVRDSARARQARVERLSVTAPIENSPWAFFIEYPNAHILAPIRLLSWKIGLVSFLVLGIGILAGVLLSNGMTSALADLTKTAEYIAGGDLKRRPHESRRQDEIGRLARSFSAMADKLSESREQLEKRISDRTADLQNAMTRLRETQDELVRKERLATIGQLASSVGHELRNPLGVMSNSVYLLERTLDSPSPKSQQYLALLRTQIKLSERIVSDLLDSARNPSPQRKHVDVHLFLTEQVERVVMPPNVTLEMNVDDTLPPMHVDPDQIGQILVNLLTNGVQSIGPHTGTLSVRARNGAGRIHIDVRDTGPGVPMELADKIFEPLFTTKARGIGLGLSVSRSLALANDGMLTVANHAQGGAVFTIELPAATSA